MKNSGRTDRLRRWLGRYGVVLRTLAMLVAVFTIQRSVLWLMFMRGQPFAAEELAAVFFVGLRFDLMVAIAIALPQMLHMTFTGNGRVTSQSSRWSIHGGLLVTIAVICFLVLAEYLFFDEFDSRFNYIAFEYLVYPTEVATNIYESYPLPLMLSALVAVTAVVYLVMRRGLDPLLHVALPMGRRMGLLAAALLILAGLWLTTDTTSQRISENRVANEIAGNGLYSFVYYAWTSRFDYDQFYLTAPAEETYQRVWRRLADPQDVAANHPGNPLDRVVNTGRPRRDYNVVLVLEESFGSDFVGVLGGRRGLTPCFDELTQRGVLFDNFYATGNRTARALEATLVSLPPIPTESILKRDHSQRVYSLATLLKQRGYQTRFIYGGRGMFDGMRSFMTANGFDRFIEQSDYENPTFTTAWGVCDEDIFNMALTEFDVLHEEGKPFFSVILTVSNHRPYTYPDGRIDRPSSQQSRKNAVKYADFALGDFFEKARGRSYYDHTIFVALGDHGARVYGAAMFPFKSYRVPLLMVLPNGEQANTRCSTLASSLDIAPTIMGVLGGSYRSTFFGRDALHIDPASAYALMQHNRNLALLEHDGRVALLGCPRTSDLFRLDRQDFSLNPVAGDDEALRDDAIAFYQTAHELYYARQLYPAEITGVTARAALNGTP